MLHDEIFGPEDTIGKAAPAGAGGGTAYWDVDHSEYGPVSEAPLRRFAQVAAGNLAAARALIPAVTHHDRADVSAIAAFRTGLKPEAQARGVKLTALAFHVAALARSLRTFPRFNAALTPDRATLVRKDYGHIGIAVDTPHGLMVPVIRDADTKGLWQIGAEIAGRDHHGPGRGRATPSAHGAAGLVL